MALHREQRSIPIRYAAVHRSFFPKRFQPTLRWRSLTLADALHSGASYELETWNCHLAAHCTVGTTWYCCAVRTGWNTIGCWCNDLGSSQQTSIQSAWLATDVFGIHDHHGEKTEDQRIPEIVAVTHDVDL